MREAIRIIIKPRRGGIGYSFLNSIDWEMLEMQKRIGLPKRWAEIAQENRNLPRNQDKRCTNLGKVMVARVEL